MTLILVVEDEADLAQVVEYNLRKAGHDVVTAARGLDGFALARERRPDLVLLDLMLPDLPGTEICKLLRAEAATRDIPIIMLTARSDEIDRVVGFEVGADDYVVKPFSVRELILRVQAILRRGAQPVEPPPQRIQFGVLEVDRDAHRVWTGGVERELTALEFRLLTTLHDRRGRVQSRSVLLADVWGITADITTRTVDTHVKRLREKLGPAGAYVETVRGAGYRFADRPDAVPGADVAVDGEVGDDDDDSDLEESA